MVRTGSLYLIQVSFVFQCPPESENRNVLFPLIIQFLVIFRSNKYVSADAKPGHMKPRQDVT